MQPLLSIVIATYNNENTLKKAVDSVLIQKFENWELLLIDDGATDSCPQIVDDYAKSDSRIKAFHKANGGCNSAFNVGLAQATGKYVTFCGADDTYEPNAFEIIAEQAAEYDYDIIFTPMNFYDCDNNQENRKLTRQWIVKEPFKIIGKNNIESQCLHFLKANFLYGTMNFYKSSIIQKYKYREDNYAADQFLNWEILDDIHSVSCKTEILYNHYIYIYIYDKNINVGHKYHPEEHSIHNELYIERKNLFSKWNRLTPENLSYICGIHFGAFVDSFSLLHNFNNPNTPTENINEIMSYYDDILFENACILGCLADADDLITVNVNSILKTCEIPHDFDNPIVKILNSIKNKIISFEEISNEIANALLDYRNPYRIGFELYKTFTASHSQSNIALMQYLETERVARTLFFTGNFEQALDTVIELFNSTISTAEQYVILALCGYNLGLTEDAENAVEVGLANFPNYPRLEELREIISTMI